jgi:hypothetical protein
MDFSLHQRIQSQATKPLSRPKLRQVAALERILECWNLFQLFQVQRSDNWISPSISEFNRKRSHLSRPKAATGRSTQKEKLASYSACELLDVF